MNKIITIMGISTIALFLVAGCTQEGQKLECGNRICESGEDGFTCPRDCCVNGDGVCREGCTSAIDDDCVGEGGCGNRICESGEDGFTCPEDCCVDGDGVCRKGCTSVIDDDCVGDKDPYMNDPSYSYHGWWLFCPFDEHEYLEGIMWVFVIGWSDPDKGGFANKLFTKDEVYEMRLELPISDIHADSDRFNVRLVHDDTTCTSMENKGRYYHIHMKDPENSIIQDFKIRPRHIHYIGSTYFGTLDSPIEGIVEVDGKKYEVTGLCSFEHSWGNKLPSPPNVLPVHVNSHYEPVVLEDSDGNRFGAIHWPWLETTGDYSNMRGGINPPNIGYLSYPKSSYTLEYLDKTVIDGLNIPKKWKVTANISEGTLEYIGNARLFSKVIPHTIFIDSMDDEAMHILTDYTGKFIYKDGGEIELTGKGVLEFVYGLHDPMYNLDERTDHKFDFGNLPPMDGFKKVQYLTPYGPGGYGLVCPSLDGDSGDYDLTEFGNSGMMI
jgi:hypothetical protein